MVGIKGFKMPKSCYDCELCYDSVGCSILEVEWESYHTFDPDKERSKNCPLVDLDAPLTLKPTEEQRKELVELLKWGTQ